MDIERVLSRLRADGRCRVYRGAPEGEIAEMEEQLELKLPADYREFLRTCGVAEVVETVIFGLGPDASKARNALDQSFIEHLDYRGTDMLMPGHLVPIASDGRARYSCIDCGKAKASRHGVVVWDYEDPKGEAQRPKKVAPGFAAWLDGLLRA